MGPARWNARGVVLMQVMVMAIIMATIATMLVQWQFGRYVLVARVESHSRGRALVQAAFHQMFTQWSKSGATMPTTGKLDVYDSMLGRTVPVNYSYSGSAPNYKVTFTADSQDWEQ